MIAIGKPFTTGVRSNSMNNHEITNTHKNATNKAATSDILVFSWAYAGALLNIPANSHPVIMYVNHILGYDIGYQLHTPLARTKIIIIMGCDVKGLFFFFLIG